MRTRTLLSAFALCGAASLIAFSLLPVQAESPPQRLPAPAIDLPAGDGPQTAVLSGGCFWGVQGVFEHVKGVQSAVSGYSGGKQAEADYETVSTGATGHAETVLVKYDPHQISYGKVLQIFFRWRSILRKWIVRARIPAPRYRSEIWVSDPDQARVAHAYIEQLTQAHTYHAPIATRVDTLNGFYPAESYHQDFLVRHPDQGYIAYQDMPKVRALQKLFPEEWQSKPVTVLPVNTAS